MRGLSFLLLVLSTLASGMEVDSRKSTAEERDAGVPYTRIASLEGLHEGAVLSRMLSELAHGFFSFNRPFSPAFVVNKTAWENLICTFRYLGNAPGSADPDGFPINGAVKSFVTSSGSGRIFWDKSNYNGTSDVSIPGVSLVDFMPRTAGNILRHGKPLDTMRNLRDYVVCRHPDVALIFQHVAQGSIDSPVLWNEHPTAPSPLYDHSLPGNVPDLAAYVIGRFLIGEASLLIGSLSDVGIPDELFPGDTPDDRVRYAEDALLALHFPDDDID